jgi:hypothetical protein
MIIVEDFHRVPRLAIPLFVGPAGRRATIVVNGVEDVDVVGEVIGKLFFSSVPVGVDEEFDPIILPQLVTVVLAHGSLEFGRMDVKGQVEIPRVPERRDGGAARAAANPSHFEADGIGTPPLGRIAVQDEVRFNPMGADQSRRPKSFRSGTSERSGGKQR